MRNNKNRHHYLCKRCGPCQRIAPEFEKLPKKYPRAVFLKVDVDKCQDTASSQGVRAMPTFYLFKNKVSYDNNLQQNRLHTNLLNCGF